MSSFLSSKSVLSENGEVNRLRKENHMLNTKISSMQSQLDQMQQISRNLEQVYSKNTELEKEIRETTSKYDDALRRLNIVQENKKELMEQLEKARLKQRESEKAFESDVSLQVERERKLMQLRIDEISGEKELISNKLSQVQFDLDKANSQIETFMNLARSFFKTEISSPALLEKLLRDGSYNDRNNNSVTNSSVDIQEYKLALKDNKKFKKKYEQMKDIINKLQYNYEQRVDEVSYSTNQKIQEHIQNNNEQKATIDRLNNQIKEMERSYRELEKIHKESKESSRNQMNQLQDQYDEAVKRTNDQVTQLNVRHKVDTENINNLKKSLADLTVKLKHLEASKNSYKNQLSENEQKMFENQLQHDSLKGQNKELIEALKAEQSKVQLLQNHLSKEYSTKKSLLEQINKSKLDNESLSSEVIQIKTQYETLLIRTEKFENENLILQEALNDSKRTNTGLEEKVTQLTSSIETMRREEHERIKKEARDKKNDPSYEPIDPSVFMFSDFPEEINSLVADIANNTTLRNSSKIRNVIQIINQHFQNVVKELQYKKDELTKMLERYKDGELKFKNVLEKVYPDISHFDSVFTNLSAQEAIVQKITNTENQIKDLMNEKTVTDDSLYDLLFQLQSNNVEDGKNYVKGMLEDIGFLQKKMDKLRYKNQILKQELVRRDNQCIEQLNGVEKEAQNIMIRMSEIEQEKKILQNRVEELTQDLLHTKNDCSNQLKNMAREHDIHIEECDRMIKKNNERLRAEMAKLHETQEMLALANTEKEQLQKTINILQISKKKRDDEITRVRGQLVTTEQAGHERIVAERQSMQNRYDTIINELKTQNTDYQNLINDLNNSITNYEFKNNELHEKICSLNLQIHQAELKHQSQTEELTRAHNIEIAQLRSDLMEKISEATLKLDSCQRQVKEARRDVMSKIALEFCSLFNTNEALDESNFEMFLHDIRDKYDELSKEVTKIRSILGIAPTQSIETAVSSLMIRQQV